MTELKIRTLKLENFKCHEALTVDFDGQPWLHDVGL